MEAGGSDENEALLLEGIDAYNRGDLSFAIERASEDIEVYAHRDLINTGTYRGRAEFERWMHNWQEAWSEITMDVRSVEALGEGYLLVDVFQEAVGASSGVPVEMDIFQLIEVRDGEITRFHLYPDRDSAMEAVERMRDQQPAAD